MYFSTKNYFFTILALLLSTGAAWSTPYEDGVYSQNRGDYANAARLFRQLAAQGDANSQFRLSLMYATGRGMPLDYSESVRLLRLAARQGNSSAQSNLGVAYVKGRGVAQDYVRAHAWFSLSALSGNPDAATNRDVAERRMTPQQIAMAKAMALQCQQGNYEGCD